MLVDADTGNPIQIFQGVPEAWYESGMAFKNMRLPNGVLVSARFDDVNGVSLSLTNTGASDITRTIRIRIPEDNIDASELPAGASREEDWIILPPLDVPARGDAAISFGAQQPLPVAGVAVTGALVFVLALSTHLKIG